MQRTTLEFRRGIAGAGCEEVVHPMRGGQLVARARGGPRSVAATAINQTAGPRRWSQFADLTAAGYWVGSQLGPSNKLINCNLVSLKVYPIKPKFAVKKLH